MARAKKNPHLDRQQAKAKKQKKLAIGLSAVLVLVLVMEVPKTLKLMNPHPAAPVVSSSAAAPPAANPTAPASPSSSGSTPPPTAAPSTPATALVNAVQVQPDPGQLTEFAHFASKDPFNTSVQPATVAAPTPASSSSKKKKASSSTPPVPKAPPAPPPTSAVISVNGELGNVSVNTDFPTSGTVFNEVGAPLFHLVSLTQTSAKVAIAGGSYADGSAALTLVVGTPVTLQNTADGKRYTLLLEPQGTQVTTTASPTAPTATTGSILPAPTGP